LCLLAWIEADPSLDQLHLGLLKRVRGVVVVYAKLEIDFVRETRGWVWRYSLWIWGCHPDCPYFFWTVSYHFFI